MPLLKLIPIARAYASEADALAAVDSLTAQNFEEDAISIITPAMIEQSNGWMLSRESKDGVDSTEMLAQVVIGVHDASRVPDSHAMVYADTLQDGKTLLLITAPFGEALLASDTLDATNCADMEEVPELEYHTWLQPAPLSALLKLPVLSHRKSWMASTFSELTEPGYLPTRNVLGGLLSDNPTPLSSKVGMDLLSDNATPLSSKFGWSLLKKDSPTPLSDKIGMKTLTSQRPANKSTSFWVPAVVAKQPDAIVLAVRHANTEKGRLSRLLPLTHHPHWSSLHAAPRQTTTDLVDRDGSTVPAVCRRCHQRHTAIPTAASVSVPVVGGYGAGIARGHAQSRHDRRAICTGMARCRDAGAAIGFRAFSCPDWLSF